MLAEEARELSEVLALLAEHDTTVRRMADAIGDCFERGGKLLTCGNGGSASEASHLAEEFTGRYHRERRSLPAICLSIDGPLITCIGNDYGFDNVFSRQIEGLGNPGDVLVALTSSGNSENINGALKAACSKGMTAIALLGQTGGVCKGCATIELIVPSHTGRRVQECHQLIVHALCELVERRIMGIPVSPSQN